MAKYTKDEIAVQLKAAIYLHVAKIIEEQLKTMKETNANQDETPVFATPTFISSLVELVYNQIISLGEDLEMFAEHAGRDVINPSDLFMVTRKNPTLQQYLKDILEKKI
ncbi:MHF histone-fold complex subunit 1 [Spathaspora sp. JA1]|nr:MHF histone-fold complex subunit 1 [Spathaspora sp. JA1]